MPRQRNPIVASTKKKIISATFGSSSDSSIPRRVREHLTDIACSEGLIADVVAILLVTIHRKRGNHGPGPKSTASRPVSPVPEREAVPRIALTSPEGEPILVPNGHRYTLHWNRLSRPRYLTDAHGSLQRLLFDFVEVDGRHIPPDHTYMHVPRRVMGATKVRPSKIRKARARLRRDVDDGDYDMPTLGKIHTLFNEAMDKTQQDIRRATNNPVWMLELEMDRERHEEWLEAMLRRSAREAYERECDRRDEEREREMIAATKARRRQSRERDDGTQKMEQETEQETEQKTEQETEQKTEQETEQKTEQKMEQKTEQKTEQ